MTLSQAQQAITAALAKATDMKVKMNIAIVDEGCNLLAFARQEGAWIGSIDIAIRKARTARYFDMETAALAKMSQPGEPLYGIEVSNGGLIIFGGGIPIKDASGEVIGAIGVSGGQVPQDEKVAKAGADAVSEVSPK